MNNKNKVVGTSKIEKIRKKKLQSDMANASNYLFAAKYIYSPRYANREDARKLLIDNQQKVNSIGWAAAAT